MIMLGSSIVLTTIAVIFMRNQVRPIRRLASAAIAFSKGLDQPDFKPEGATEVRAAAKAIIIMRNRLRRQVTQRTEMLSGVSHDLRTPLTRMKLELALLPASPEVDGLKRDVAEMTAMVDAYLAFAKGEGEEVALQTDISALVQEVVAAAQRQHSHITLQPAPAQWQAVRPQALRRCISNVLANAARYGKQVQVQLKIMPQLTIIVVDDDGPGVPAGERENVFKPFVRLDAARTSASGSVGLGLTIARDIARNHGGDINLAASPTGGLRVEIYLPI
jgi:two-component system osmolarity sensor histidine kinase EnvZ